jgi:hypothetical protein
MLNSYRVLALTAGACTFALLVFACAAGPGSGPCGFTPNDTVKADADTVFRAKTLACFTDNECRNFNVTPRCSAPELARCDRTQRSSKSGICVFQLTGTDTTCNACYEGDIRYCDLGPWGSCTQANPSACGIQRCSKADNGPIPPAATWGDCTPLANLLDGGL